MDKRTENIPLEFPLAYGGQGLGRIAEPIKSLSEAQIASAASLDDQGIAD